MNVEELAQFLLCTGEDLNITRITGGRFRAELPVHGLSAVKPTLTEAVQTVMTEFNEEQALVDQEEER